jgi:sulfite exporter TauE/SafE
MALSVLIAAWVAGVLGGVHCVAMCGGFVAAITAREAGGTVALLPARVLVRRQLGYHAGRVGTYAALGAGVGALGSATLLAIDLSAAQRGIYVVANALLLLLAIGLALRTRGLPWLQRIGVGAFGVVLPVLRPLLQRPGSVGRVALGLVWGLVPCALIYSVLPLALFAGGAWQGAAVMLAFGFGTLPNLAAAGALLGRAAPALRGSGFRFAAAALVAGFALVGLYRALHVPGALAQGPFCLTL